MNARQVVEENFGRWLWFQRTSLGLTQKAFAKKIKIGQTTVSGIEKGRFLEPITRKKIFFGLGFTSMADGMASIAEFAERWRKAA